jgi:cyclic-di-GMP phosphodiesterase, flagellum assembly factor TipF
MTSSKTVSGRSLLLDVVVLCAMAITATAFTAGLIINSGVDVMTGVIAGAALYMVMASSHYVIMRSARSVSVSSRLDELEEALVVLDSDLQRIDQVEDDVARLDLLTDRVERLDAAVSDSVMRNADIDAEQLERLAVDLGQLEDRLEALRSDFDTEAQTQREQIGAELKLLEEAVKELSQELRAAAPALSSAAQGAAPSSEGPLFVARGENEGGATPRAPFQPENLAEFADENLDEDQVESIVALLADEMALDLAADDERPLQDEPGFELGAEDTDLDPEADKRALDLGSDAATLDFGAGEAAPERGADKAPVEDELLGVLRQAIDANRIGLYLQPIVALPERKLRYYDALTCVLTEADDVLLPDSYRGLAASAGLAPRIDDVTITKSVELLRRVGPDSKLKGLFCALSPQSLLDRDFFPELVELLEENSAFGDRVTFQLSQPALNMLSDGERNSLKTIGKLGFGFALGQAADLDVDFGALRDHFFRFIKIDAETLLYGREETRAPVAAADMVTYLGRFDLDLIVEQVEDENSVHRLMDCGAELAQGDLFGAPRPMTPEMFGELEDADAA